MSDDFTSLAHDFGEVPPNAGNRLRQATEITSRNIKDAWADKLEGARQIPAGSRSITYDLGTQAGAFGGAITGEIGAQRGRKQARFVKIVENGSYTLAPRGYGAAALQENAADFEHGIEKAIDDALKEAGL